MHIENFTNSSEYGKPVRETIYFSPDLKENEGRSSPLYFFKEDEVIRKEDGTPLTCPIYHTALQEMRDGSVVRIRVPEALANSYIVESGAIGYPERESMQESVPEGLPRLPVDQRAVAENIVRPVENKDTTEISEMEKANYRLKALHKEIYLDYAGEHLESQDQIKVQITIYIGGKYTSNEFFIKCTEISNIVGIVGKKFSYATSVDAKAKGVIENDFRIQTFGIPEIRCYKEAGWHLINGQHVYLHQEVKLEGINILTQLKLPADVGIEKKDLFPIFDSVTQMYQNKAVIYTLFVYSLLGVSYRIFSEAGYPPRFLLFLLGKTGSFKTSIAKVLYTQLCEDKYRIYPRRIDADTSTSLEISLVEKGVDTITLLDDFAPAKTTRQKSAMAEKLEIIVRIAGDGSSKSRSNSNLEDCRGKGLKGMVAITGELKGTGLSSNLRCLYCEIEKDEVNTEILSWFQRHPNVYTSFIQHFVYYLANTWDGQLELIRNSFEWERREAEKVVKAGRLIDTFATMRLMVEILDGFLRQYCGIGGNTMWKEEAKSGIGYIVARSEQMSETEEPAKLFMRTLINMMNNNQVKVIEDHRSNFLGSKSDGFQDKGYVYLLPEQTYKKVAAELYHIGGQIALSLDELTKMLFHEGYIMAIANGAGKKTYYARIELENGKKIKFWKISKSVIEQLTDEE